MGEVPSMMSQKLPYHIYPIILNSGRTPPSQAAVTPDFAWKRRAASSSSAGGGKSSTPPTWLKLQMSKRDQPNLIWWQLMTINLVPLTFGTLWACKASRNWTGVSCIYSCHIFCRELMAFIWLIECPNVIVASHEQIHIPGTEKRQRLANVGFSIGRSKTLWGEPSTKLHRKRKGLLMRKGKWDLPLSIQGVHSCTQDSIQGHKHRFQLWHCYIIVVRWVPSWSSCAKETW